MKILAENSTCRKLRSWHLVPSVQFSSVAQLCPTLRPQKLQHARPPCPSPTPQVYSNSFPLSQWCQPTILSPVTPFFSCPQDFPASESFPVSQPFTWGGQSTGASALASFPPKKSQSWSPSEWIGWISFKLRQSEFSLDFPVSLRDLWPLILLHLLTKHVFGY